MAKRVKTNIACLAVGVAILLVIIVLNNGNTIQPVTFQFLAGTLLERVNESRDPSRRSSYGPYKRKFYYYSMNGNYDEICSRANEELIHQGFVVSNLTRKYRQAYSHYANNERHVITIIDKSWIDAIAASGPVVDADGVGVIKINIVIEKMRPKWLRWLMSRPESLRWRMRKAPF